MTENKRFILKADYDWWGVLDTTGEIKGEYNDCFSTDEVVDLLNELDEKYVDEFSLRETLQIELQRVEEENKELKKQVNDLQFNKSIGQREYQRRLSE